MKHADVRRGLAAFGALAGAAAVALAAYASHAADAAARGRLDAAVFQLALHALAISLFAPRQRRRMEFAALSAWCVGLLLFSGSLVASVFAGTSTALAPVGGVLLIFGWMLQALAILLHRRLR